MKKIFLITLTILSFAVNAQVSRNRLKQPIYSWISRQVPTNAYLDSTFKSFWNIVDNGTPITSTFVTSSYVPYSGSTSNLDLNNKSIIISATGAGNGYLDLTRSGFQMGAPAANTLRIGSTNSGQLQFIDGSSAFRKIFTGSITANQTYTWPNNSGTVALTSDLSAYTPTITGGYLPVINPTFTGTLQCGTLTFNDSGILAALQSSVNGYNQFILQNSSNANNASTGLVVTNDVATAGTFYGEFGMNSSTFTGTPIYSKPNAVYATATNGDLVLATTNTTQILMGTNATSVAALTINTLNAVSIPTLVAANTTGTNQTITNNTLTTITSTAISNASLVTTGSLNVTGTTTLTGASNVMANVSLASGVNIVCSTTTGNKFGTGTTELIGFYGAAPVNQRSAATDLGVMLSTIGLRAPGATFALNSSGALTWSGTEVHSNASTTFKHITGNTALGTPTLGAGAGTGATFTVSTNNPTDMAFTVSVTIGTGASANSPIITIPFGTAYTAVPKKAVSAGNATTAGLSGTTAPFWTTSLTQVILNSNTLGNSSGNVLVYDVILIQ